jgi:DNA polymerase-3 subunit delta
MMALRPPVFWKEEVAFRAELKRWSSEGLARALTRLLDAEIQCKTGAPAELVAAHTLMSLGAAR